MQSTENVRVIANVRVAKSSVDPWKTGAHVRGIREGNERGAIHQERGVIETGFGARGTARRSTGINPNKREPIDPTSPNLSPA